MARRATRPTEPKHLSRELDLGDDETACIVVVADTHSNPHPKAAEHIEAASPNHILHAGDIGRLGVIDELGAIAPTTAVRGNIDGRELPDSIDLTIRSRGEPRLRIFLTHIAVRGPRLHRDVAREARAYAANLVVCGHSHVPLIARDGELTVFNPGSIGPRRFTLPITFGVMRLGPKGLSLRHVDCETGEVWAPPAA